MMKAPTVLPSCRTRMQLSQLYCIHARPNEHSDTCSTVASTVLLAWLLFRSIPPEDELRNTSRGNFAVFLK